MQILENSCISVHVEKFFLYVCITKNMLKYKKIFHLILKSLKMTKVTKKLAPKKTERKELSIWDIFKKKKADNSKYTQVLLVPQ
jgi:hypothetical protein